MKTVRLTDNLEGIKAAAEILKSDGIVALPTETVYGLAASAYSDTAIGKVFAAKGRPQDNPLIVHISDMDMLGDVVADFPGDAKLQDLVLHDHECLHCGFRYCLSHDITSTP